MGNAGHYSPPGPLTPFRDHSVDETVEVMSALAAHLHWLQIVNPTTDDLYLNLYDTVESVNVGTTTPTLSIFVPASDGVNDGARDWGSEYGVQFIKGIKYAITQTNGSSSPSAACTVNGGLRPVPR